MPIKGQTLVTYKDTFLAVGGVDDQGLDGTQIYQLKCSSTNCESSYWHKMEQSLMIGRKFAAAMMIPDILTDCVPLQPYDRVRNCPLYFLTFSIIPLRWLKVSKFLKQIFLFSFEPKNVVASKFIF